MMSGQLQTAFLSDAVGSEVTGFDIPTQARTEIMTGIRKLLDQRHVVVFRDQRLEPEQLLAFTRLLGEIDGSHVQSDFTLPGHPDIFVISNTERDGRPLGTRTVGHHWHTDWCYKAFPASYTMLYGVEVPKAPHHTLFASQLRVYHELSEAERDDLRGRTASYSFEKTHNAKRFYAPLTAAQKAQTPTVSHPMLRLHPGTGREGLYVNRADCVGVSGMDDAAGVALVEALVEKIVDPAFVFAHEWRQGDLVIWDNRVLLHAATPFDFDHDRRVIYRTTTKGERPIPARPKVSPLPDKDLQDKERRSQIA